MWKVKFLMYSHAYQFDTVLEEGANHTKRGKDMLDLSVLDPSNIVNKETIKMK